MKRKVLILGESYMNLEMKIEAMSKEGSVTYGDKYSFHPYGKTDAAAITAAKMGGTCVLCTKLANDMNGARLKKYYESCGVDTRMISSVENAQTGFSVTLYDDGGDCRHYVSKGANRYFTKADVDEAFGIFPDFFLVPQEALSCVEPDKKEPVAQLESDDALDEDIAAEELKKPSGDVAPEKPVAKDGDIPEKAESQQVEDPRGRNELALYACNKAMEKKIDMIVDYSSASSDLPLSEFTGIKVLIISDDTLYKITGFYPNSDDRTIRSLVALQSKIKSRYYVVLTGEDTSFIYDGSAYEKVTLPVPEKEKKDIAPKMKETYTGAFIAEYLETKNVVRACTYAGVASLLTKSNDGVLEHIPTRSEVEAYISEKHINTMKW